MTRKYLTARRKRNQALAAEDASNRCAVCKRNLLECSEIIEDFITPGKCCSDACLADLLARHVKGMR